MVGSRYSAVGLPPEEPGQVRAGNRQRVEQLGHGDGVLRLLQGPQCAVSSSASPRQLRHPDAYVLGQLVIRVVGDL